VPAGPTVSCVVLPHSHTHMRGGLLCLTLTDKDDSCLHCLCCFNRIFVATLLAFGCTYIFILFRMKHHSFCFFTFQFLLLSLGCAVSMNVIVLFINTVFIYIIDIKGLSLHSAATDISKHK
jgi:hypothetical protein